ncbi:unnamed protein product [Paramecium octaurelia]|uniref:Choline transporter-like protein n=1 Tax=Paramecium octaurelia TaxID=43137 RepID=A0A8S1X2Y3_PAROT|nr:unnamed protein product [Paramecium octaurelia]
MQIQDGNNLLLNLSNGPIDNSRRSCTNVFCTVLYSAILLSILGIGLYMNQSGNLLLIDRGYDPDHRPCGIDTLRDYPFIYFTTLNSDFLWKTVCVQECPSVTVPKHKHLQYNPPTTTTVPTTTTTPIGTTPNSQLKCAVNSIVTSCSQATLYNSIKFDQRVCIPTDPEQFKIVQEALKMGFLHQMISDISGAKYTLFIFIVLGICFTLSFTYLLKWCSKTVIWFIIFIIVVLSIFFGYYSYLQYKAASSMTIGLSPTGYLFQAVIWWCFGLGTIILTICFYKRINLAIAIIKSASDFVTKNVSIVIVPVFSTIATLILTVIFIYIALIICSTGTPGDKQQQWPFGQLKYTLLEYFSGFYLLFATFWTYALIIGVNSFIIAGSVCVWYWQQGKSGQEHVQPLNSSWKRCFVYHFGSIVLGALLLGLISIFRSFFEYLYRNAEYMRNTDGCQFCFKCCACCIWCFERFLQYLNQNIYVQINMTGDGFFHAAKKGLDIMSNNPSIVMQVVGLGDLINNIARIMITLSISMFFFRSISELPQLLFGGIVINPYNPTLLLAIIIFVIATVFTNIFGVAIESILHLYCVDQEIARAKSGSEDAEMCPAALREFLNDKVFTQQK